MKKLYLSLIFFFLNLFAFAENNYSLYRNNGKYGLIDINKRIVLEAEYDEIQFNEVYLCKSTEKGNFVYNNKIEMIHQFDADDKRIIMTSPWLFYVIRGYALNEKKYLRNIKNNTLLEVKHRFEKGNILEEPYISSQNGYYSKDSQEFLKHFYHAFPFRNNRAVVLNDKREGEIIDENFSTILDHICGTADYYSEGLLPVVFFAEDGYYENYKTGKSCYVDLNGNIVYECDFDFNIIDRDTIKHIQPSFVIGSFNEGVAVVQKSDNTWLILDKNFNKYYLPEEIMVESYSYSNGLLLVSKKIEGKTRFGYLNKKGNLVIPFEYTNAESFDGKYAIVKKDYCDGVIDKKGKFTPVTKFLKK